MAINNCTELAEREKIKALVDKADEQGYAGGQTLGQLTNHLESSANIVRRQHNLRMPYLRKLHERIEGLRESEAWKKQK